MNKTITEEHLDQIHASNIQGNPLHVEIVDELLNAIRALKYELLVLHITNGKLAVMTVEAMTERDAYENMCCDIVMYIERTVDQMDWAFEAACQGKNILIDTDSPGFKSKQRTLRDMQTLIKSFYNARQLTFPGK